MLKLDTRWRWMVKITPRPLCLRQELWYRLNNKLFGTQNPLTSLILQVNIEAETVSPWRWKPSGPIILPRDQRILRIYYWYDNWHGKKRSPWKESYRSNISPSINRTWIVSSWVPGRHLSYQGGVRSFESLDTMINNFTLNSLRNVQCNLVWRNH
jgi:hypothetical protein